MRILFMRICSVEYFARRGWGKPLSRAMKLSIVLGGKSMTATRPRTKIASQHSDGRLVSASPALMIVTFASFRLVTLAFKIG